MLRRTVSDIAPQRRARRIAMSDAERDAFLAEQRVCRVASVDAQGDPHVTPLWFIWDGAHLWLNSIVRAQRHANLLRNPRVAVVVDAGHNYDELRGVEFHGTVHAVGDQPRDGSTPDPTLEPVEAAFAGRYIGDGAAFVHDGRHGWLRVDPDRQYTWDFRKLASP
jgi:Pyridoxamine 5'-phosphate oxidase